MRYLVIVFLISLAAVTPLRAGLGLHSGKHPCKFFKTDGTRVDFMRIADRWVMIEEQASGRRRSVSISLPKDANPLSIAYYRDKYMLLTKNHGGQGQSLYCSGDLRSWDYIGHFQVKNKSKKSAFWILPFKKDEFLVYLDFPETINKVDGTSLAVAKLQNGLITPSSVIPVTYRGESLFVPRGSEGAYGTPWRYLGLIDAQVSQQPVICGDSLVLVSKRNGVFWVLDLVTGRMRYRCLFDGLRQEQLVYHDRSIPVIANISCAPGGKIILVSRSKKASLSIFTAAKGEGDSGKAYDAWIDQSLRHDSDLEWWSFDPESGIFTPMATPSSDIPSKIESGEQWKRFEFEAHVDGTFSFIR